MRKIVVMPTYNEVENIETIVDGLLRFDGLDVLVVDDSSPDGTGMLVDDIASRHPDGQVNLLSRRNPQGLGVAYRAGFAWALDNGYDVVVQMDADGSHPVDVVAELLGALASGADLALGARYVPGGGTDPNWAWHRKVLSVAGNTYARTLLGLPYRDLTGGFKAWRADLLRSIRPIGGNLSGYAFQIHTTYSAHRLGAIITEIPFLFKERVHGTSKMHSRIILEGIASVLTMKREFPPVTSEIPESRWPSETC